MIEVTRDGGDCSACDAPIGSATDNVGFRLTARPPSDTHRGSVAMDAWKEGDQEAAMTLIRTTYTSTMVLCPTCVRKMAGALFVVVGGDHLGLRLAKVPKSRRS